MPKQTFGSLDQFRQAAQNTDQFPDEIEVRHSFDTEIKAADDGRSILFTISTASVDRMGDTIAVDGWKLDNFRKNPVVLWGHDSSSLPVARANKVWIEDGKLKAEAEFTPPGMTRFNDTVFDMLKAGFLNATSVGFVPLKYAFTDDPQRRFGIDFMEQELLEFSVVSIPANPEALIDAKSMGIDIEPLIDQYTAHLAKLGLAVVSKERIERIERAATAQRIAESRRRRERDLDLARIKSF